tara:strand:- start:119 stop:553 length:435 start_codon:yes stop_codon:yes gene_type:complete
MRKVEQQTITNVMNAMNEYNSLLQKSNKLSSADALVICKKYSISTSVFYCAVFQGYFEKLMRGFYKPYHKKIEPIDARKIYKLALHKKHYNSKNKAFISSHRPKKQLELLKKTKVNIIPKVNEKVILNIKKELNLFWGLIKVKF